MCHDFSLQGGEVEHNEAGFSALLRGPFVIER